MGHKQAHKRDAAHRLMAYPRGPLWRPLGVEPGLGLGLGLGPLWRPLGVESGLGLGLGLGLGPSWRPLGVESGIGRVSGDTRIQVARIWRPTMA